MWRHSRGFRALLGGALIGLAAVVAATETPDSIALEIARWEGRVKERPEDLIALTRLGEARMREARETGNLGAYPKAEVAFEAALREYPGYPAALAGLAATRAGLHRFAEARELAQEILQRAPTNTEARLLLADAEAALGNVEAAAKILSAQADSPAVFSRRAELARLRGENDEARRLCLRAAEASEARGEAPESVAWYRVRAGELFFRTGKLMEAEEQYLMATERAPQSFAAREHLAELRGAQEKFPEAIALYEGLSAGSHRPDIEQALGDLYVFMRQPEKARTHYDKALEGYLASVEWGEVHFIHHLAGFYADAREDGAEAVKWARKDIALRQSVTAHEGLAWALYRAGEFAESRREIETALASGIKDAHITYHAGLIFSAAGDLEQGQKFMREAEALNPHFNGFHVHR